MSKSKTAAKFTSSDFGLDYSCTLSVRKNRSRSKVKTQHRGKERDR